MSFSINCLEITDPDIDQHRNIYKNLCVNTKDRRFFFNDYYIHDQKSKKPEKNTHRAIDDDFFGKGINIQAIVGKNGSGKSTLMDLMYMAINNFAFMFERGHVRNGAADLHFIPQLYVNLYFSMDEKELYLENAGDDVRLCQIGGAKPIKDFKLKDALVLDDYNERDDNNIVALVKNFFYTIVSNYSMQSLISSNYRQNVKSIDNNDGHYEISKDTVYYPWIDDIFHKNDGYIRSIVLNPYRHSGNINLNNEVELSKDRLASILIWKRQMDFAQKIKAKHAGNVDLDYAYIDLQVTFRENFVRDKFNEIFKTKYESDDVVVSLIDQAIDNSRSIGHGTTFFKDMFYVTLCTQLKIDAEKWTRLKKLALAYIALKVYTISQKYPCYSNYSKCVSFSKKFDVAKDKISNFNQLLQKIEKDESHITKKIRRAIHFINADKIPFTGKKFFSFEVYSKNIAAYDAKYRAEHINDFFYKVVQNDGQGHLFFQSPAHIDECLPPSLFEYDLKLKKSESGDVEEISYSQLSSGEIQLLQTLSIHMYHILNLISIQKDDAKPKRFSSLQNHRPVYSHINLVFDEVEICFHPEYQRKFVKRLLDMLNMLSIPFDCFLNIIILTHSPFILSDIPVNNILYLEGGNQVSKDEQTFAANINYLLSDSFFLDQGFVGEFARNKIAHMVSEITNNKKENEYDVNKWKSIEVFVKNFVGEPILKKTILRLLGEYKHV